MNTNLSIECLRSFVAVVNTGSMSSAADELGITQSAISLQIKKLSNLAQSAIFIRRSQGLYLTRAGKVLLSYARQVLEIHDRTACSLEGEGGARAVRVGLIPDCVGTISAHAMTCFTRQFPELDLRIQVGSSAELMDLFSGALLDLLMCVGQSGDPAAIATVPMVWLGAPDAAAKGVLPLALLERPCVFRDAAIEALEANGRPYEVVLETMSISVLQAAVAAGLGVTCRTATFGERKLNVLRHVNLALPDVTFSLHCSPSESEGATGFATALKSALSDVLAFGDDLSPRRRRQAAKRPFQPSLSES